MLYTPYSRHVPLLQKRIMDKPLEKVFTFFKKHRKFRRKHLKDHEEGERKTRKIKEEDTVCRSWLTNLRTQVLKTGGTYLLFSMEKKGM